MTCKMDYLKPSIEVIYLEQLSILDSFSGEGEIDQFEDGGEIQIKTFSNEGYSFDDDNIW